MKWKARSFALILGLAAAQAQAEPATPQGAKQVLDGYIAIFGPAIADKGIVSVDPQDDSYKVTWHSRRVLDLIPTPPDELQMGDFAYQITPGAGGAWRVTADAFPSIVFDAPTDKGRMSGKIDVTGMHLDISYDPAQPVPFASHSTFGDIVADVRVLDGGATIPLRIQYSDLQADMKQTTTDGGANLALHETLRAFVQKMSIPVETQPNAKIDASFTFGPATVDGTIDQFRTQQALAAWRFVLAQKDQPKNATSLATLKTLLAAGLPGWAKMNLTTDISDLAFEMPLAEAHMKGFRETIDLPGFTEVATGGFGLKIDEFNMRSLFLPEGFELLLPLSLDFAVGMKIKGLDRIARVALDDHDFMVEKDVSPEGQAKIEQIFKSSAPTFTLAPGYLRSPLIDLAYQGEVQVSPNDSVKGHILVSVDSLDKLIALVKPFAILSPEVAKATLAIGAVKGMATTGPDGRLAWNIEMSGPPAQATVNGVPFPIGK
ncbi:hypothetical protein [Methylocapsa sp. S129]|uniref:hypothetical protein n=1 Tax=Methylocapsa sp. S129 TaxID=1641869 RepID=UPI00131E551B|nr:hypothetical protein [Methylocapsa sp. S129]